MSGAELPPAPQHQPSGVALMRPTRLPVESERIRDLICGKVEANLVTLISGATGSGKSSKVPQMLLARLGGPVLVSQPRRVAAVSLARRVADERGCELGGEVGYRIGHERCSGSDTRLVFCTCGILLEDLLLHGPGTLENYSVVVIDEVHERSVESDLVLGIVKQHLLAAPKSRTRFVLMSATFDSKRYRDFFAPCLERGERLEIVAIPDHNTFLLGHIHNTRELYLDQAIKELQGAAGLAAWARALPDTFAAQATELLSSERIEPAGLALVARLVAQLHTTDADLSRHILVFLPTYRSMEDCYNHVSAAKLLGLEVHALHSSTDTRASNRAIEESAPGCRKLILATNVAESSLTIRNLAYVIDLCRTVEVAWDHAAQSSKAKVCWASKSQARQRAGRTGRTCSGTVYRLIPRSTWQGLAEFETPALILASLREETLRLCCSRSRLTSDPGRLMSACLDAPQPETITQALQALVQMRAIAPALGNTSKRGGGGGPLYVPTEYGRILASMPVGLAQSRLVVAAAAQGLLAEGALLAAVQAVLPCPIQRPFAQPELYAANLQRFCGGSADRACQESSNSRFFSSEMSDMANLAAAMLWQLAVGLHPLINLLALDARSFRDYASADALVDGISEDQVVEVKERLARRRAGANWAATPDLLESAWCKGWRLDPSSLRICLRLAEDLEETVQRQCPALQQAGYGKSPWWISGGALQYPDVALAGPLTSIDDLCGAETASALGNIIKSALRALTVPGDEPCPQAVDPLAYLSPPRPTCVYFAQGRCSKGVACPFSHDSSALLPICKNFASRSGCRFGAACRYRHPDGPQTAADSATLELTGFLNPDGRLSCGPQDPSRHHDIWASGSVLVLGEDLSFAAAFSRRRPGQSVTAAFPQSRPATQPSAQGVDVLYGVDPSELHCNPRVVELFEQVPGSTPGCGLVAWTFQLVYDDGDHEPIGNHQQAMGQFFCSLSRLAARTSNPFRLCLAMRPEQMRRLWVNSSARKLGWVLQDIQDFSSSNLGFDMPLELLSGAKVYLFENMLLGLVQEDLQCDTAPFSCWPEPPAGCTDKDHEQKENTCSHASGWWVPTAADTVFLPYAIGDITITQA